MKVGMMWFDNDPKKTLVAKIIEAADHYRTKYGQVPDMCMVHPSMVPEVGLPKIEGVRNLGSGAWQVGRVSVRPLRSILPNNLWIGVDEKVVG